MEMKARLTIVLFIVGLAAASVPALACGCGTYQMFHAQCTGQQGEYEYNCNTNNYTYYAFEVYNSKLPSHPGGDPDPCAAYSYPVLDNGIMLWYHCKQNPSTPANPTQEACNQSPIKLAKMSPKDRARYAHNVRPQQIEAQQLRQHEEADFQRAVDSMNADAPGRSNGGGL